MQLDTILAILGILVGGGGIAGYIKTLRAARAEDVAALRSVIETLQVDYARLKTDNEEMRARIDELQAEHVKLKKQYAHVLAWARPRGYEPPPSW